MKGTGGCGRSRSTAHQVVTHLSTRRALQYAFLNCWKMLSSSAGVTGPGTSCSSTTAENCGYAALSATAFVFLLRGIPAPC
jgi:hypothetical protein